MNVSAKDLGTGKVQSMVITGGSALPKDEIDRMMREAEQYADEDHSRREAAEVRNQAESLVYPTEKFLKDNEDKVPADVKSEVDAAIGETKEALKSEDSATIRSARRSSRPPARSSAPRSTSRRRPPVRRPVRPAGSPPEPPAAVPTTTWWTPRSSTRARVARPEPDPLPE